MRPKQSMRGYYLLFGGLLVSTVSRSAETVCICLHLKDLYYKAFGIAVNERLACVFCVRFLVVPILSVRVQQPFGSPCHESLSESTVASTSRHS